MYEWNETVQRMIDWVEEHLDEQPMLPAMAQKMGYSPAYCSTRFHQVCGMSIKQYAAGRRLARAALAIRDTDERVLDIALRFGYSSQEALTRAFRDAFGCTPGAYRRRPVPVPLSIRKVIYFPEHYRAIYEGGKAMSNSNLRKANVRVEYIPAHRYMGVWDDAAEDYGAFWQRHDCDEVCGTLDSLSHLSDPIVTAHTAGWHRVNGKRRYFYGMGVPAEYAVAVPDGFEARDIPGGYYLVFYHPAFDYLADNGEVMRRVEELAWQYDLEKECHGKWLWDEEARPCYQRHHPEALGYEVLRPVRKG